MRKAVFIFFSLLLIVSIAAIPSDTISAKPASPPELSPPPPAQEGPQEAEKTLISYMAYQLKEAKKLTDDDDIIDELNLTISLIKKAWSYIKKGDEQNAFKVKSVLIEQFLAIRRAMDNSKGLSKEQLEQLEYKVQTAELKLYHLIELEDEYVPAPASKPTPEEEKTTPIEKGPAYSVKFLCGPASSEEGVERGTYSTAINIHNPSGKTITIWIKAVKAKPLDETRGKISRYREVELKPDEAINVDCSTIRNLLEPSGEAKESISAVEFVEGFAVIRSPTPLDVVAVYSGVTPDGPFFQVKDYSLTSAGIFPTTPPETEKMETPPDQEEAPPTTGEAAPPTKVEEAKLGKIIIDPVQARNQVGTKHIIVIKVLDTNDNPVPNAKVHVTQSGAHNDTVELVTNAKGKAGCYYTGENAGIDTIVATINNLSATATKEWYIPETGPPQTGPAELTPTTGESE